MLGLAARSEGLDDEHAATATGARLLQEGARLIGFIRLGWRAALRLCSARRYGEQLAGAGNIVGAAAAGQTDHNVGSDETPWAARASGNGG
jgi:hypothetical protein